MPVRLSLATLCLGTALACSAPGLAQSTGADSLTPPGASEAPDAGEVLDESVSGETSLNPQEQAEPEISVPGGEIVVTGQRSRDVTRSSAQVVSVLTAEEIARTGEGDIAGALGRVTGLSVQGSGFVYVRGLGDRYSLALLNGLPLPSPEPLSRVVPLDIFPTDVVASSLVQKSYSANFPGEFGGGVINLTTRAIPEESFLEIGVGISGDTLTTGEDGFAYFGSDLDPLGFDDGSRDAPPALRAFFDSGRRLSDLSIAEQGAIAADFGNPNLLVVQRLGNLPPNWSAGITAGTALDLGAEARLGVIATASVSNKWRNRTIRSQTAINANLDLDSDFTDQVTDNRVLVNGLLGFGLELGEHRFRLTNLYIRDTLKQSQIGVGEDFQTGFSQVTQDTGWFERQLLDSQAVAELRFGELSVDLRGGYARTDREAPFEAGFTYVRTNNPADPLGDRFVNTLDRQVGTASVAFSNLTETLWYGGFDIGGPVTDWLRATVGYAYTDTDRRSERREFLLNAPTSFPDAVGALRPDLLLGDAIVDFFDIGLIETTQADPAFAARLRIHAGYGKLVVEPVDGITIDVGARYETALQRVDPLEVFATPSNSGSATRLANDYVLPAATVTWEVADGLQLRASASRTIARPQFRELVFQTYYDPETNRQFNGNPFLIDSRLTNAEARAEYYFGRGNRVSLAGFWKDIKNPIEAYSSFSDNDQVTSFANAPRARLYGAELETQFNRDLSGLGQAFATKRAVLVANYTWTQSEIRVRGGDITRVFPGGTRPASDFFFDGVPLTGQSDHLANLQFGIEDTDKLQQVTLLVSYASRRVTSRGTSGLPDIVENPGLRLDLVAREQLDFLGQPIELKFELRNLTGRDNFEYQSNGERRIEVNSYAVGRSASLSVSAEF